jgi:hypothetical protein
MFRIELPEDDWGLLLTPRFAGLGSPGQEIALALLVVVPALLLFWLYRYELRLVRRVTAFFLITLRLTLVALLWFVVCWQPILARAEIEEVPGRVLIALDLSGSINTPDPQRTPLEKLLLARALNIRPETNLPAVELVDKWIEHYQQHGEETPPVWLAPGEVGDAAQRQQLHDQVCAAVDKLTRLEILEKILAPDGLDLLRRLQKDHQVQVIGFDQTAWEIKGKSGPFAVDPDKLTDLGQPLARALEVAGQGKGKLLGVLLLTDGRHNTGPDPEAKAAECKVRHVPVYPVALGGKKPPPDIAVVKVTAPTNLLQKTPAQLSADIRVTNIPAGDIRVELYQAGEAKPKEQILKHTGGTKKTYTVEFPLQADKVGTHQLTVKVKPVSPKVKEITEQNNSQTIAVRVVEDKAKVLLVDGEARWEFYYLANALIRDEAIKLEQVLFVQPNIGAVPKSQLKEAGHPATQLPAWDKDSKQPDPLFQYQCILLGDVAPEYLPTADRERLARFVADGGGTLMVLAGKQAMPLAYVETPSIGNQPDPLAKLLPVQNLHLIKPKDGFGLTLTPAGDQAPYLALEETPAESLKTWSKLPRHHWGLIGRAKPGATVLAYVKDEQTGLPPLADKKADPQRDNAALVIQNYGLGRVMFLGLDSTWRWRYRKGDFYHHRFWGQLILWAASDQLLPAGNKYVRYGTKQPVYKGAEDVNILVRLEEAAPTPPAQAKVQARVILTPDKGDEQTVAVVPLTADAGGRLFKGVAKDLPAGKFRIEVDIPELADQLKVAPDGKAPAAATFVVLPTESIEQSQLAVDWSLLNSLARVSGAGPEALTPDQLDALLDRLKGQVTAHEQGEERRPWQDEPLTWYFLGAFLCLLTVEWVIRKFAALP